MGLLDLITGRKAPPEGIPRSGAAELRTALLDLNRDTAPFVVRAGGPEDADITAEWRIVDAQWYEIFAKAGVKRGAQVLLRFDEATGEVRNVQRDFSVEWRAGLPHLAFASEAFRGQSIELSFGAGVAFREDDLRLGKVYEYRFQTRELKSPLQELTARHGWTWRPLAFGRL
ncbi:hypothetical protein [Rubellimicrobium arenae]|uniref:hypothetical protein n=1 Tax=Rubellimicrobium arenae TaxID=2817372 RepID=UPI001B30E5C0|nr:hypothetical protein [Rubellimicrobium arenae]